jgi:hypothetical protein
MISNSLPRGTVTGTAADEELLFKQQRLGHDGADTAWARELGYGDDQLHRDKNQVAHRQGRLPWTLFSTKLLVYGASRYDSRIRTPQPRRPSASGVALGSRLSMHWGPAEHDSYCTPASRRLMFPAHEQIPSNVIRETIMRLGTDRRHRSLTELQRQL